jgi:hypothetical protein
VPAHGLKSRLRKLEARIEPVAPSWNDYFARAEQLALTVLSPTDRGLVAQMLASRSTREELAASVWERWRSAFDRAVVELRIPWSMEAADAWL